MVTVKKNTFLISPGCFSLILTHPCRTFYNIFYTLHTALFMSHSYTDYISVGSDGSAFYPKTLWQTAGDEALKLKNSLPIRRANLSIVWHGILFAFPGQEKYGINIKVWKNVFFFFSRLCVQSFTFWVIKTDCLNKRSHAKVAMMTVFGKLPYQTIQFTLAVNQFYLT